MTAFLSLTFVPTHLKAATEAKGSVTASANSAEATKANALLNRLNEIKALSKTKLNSSEKTQLRKEVRSIRSQLKSMHAGIYLSVGAIIIIILLLILLL